MTKTERKHLNTFTTEIKNRGGEVSIYHSPFNGAPHKNCYDIPLKIIDVGKSENRKVWLLHSEGWRKYSNRFGARPASLSYLCGYDDNGPWAVRVPGTYTTVVEALNWIIPSIVLKAIEKGKKVKRQGDVYGIETTKTHDGKGIENISSHEWHQRARVLLHNSDNKHNPIVFNYPVRFIAQTAYQMGRGAGGGFAD